MKYFVTIYVDKLFEKDLLNLDFTHTFLGLTRKHPDELGEFIFKKNIQHLDYEFGKMVIFSEEKIKYNVDFG